MKLGLGTVQFGIPYGATNTGGQVEPGRAQAILRLALENDIDLFDTAPAYGSAEQLIGASLPPSVKVVTKTSIKSGASFNSADVDAVRLSFLESLKRLQRTRAYALLVHSPDDLRRPGGKLIVDLLMDLRARGMVQRIGVSVYTQAQLEYCLRQYSLDLYQIPLNYLDQRLIRSGILRDVQSSGAEIHARSVFLQGILLASPEELPQYFSRWRNKLAQIRDAIIAAGASPLAAALDFVRRRTPASHAIVGATSAGELQQILHSQLTHAAELPFEEFAIDDEALIDPSLWPAVRAA